jgi:dihydropteroate synthase
MPNSEFSYILPSIPGNIAREYLSSVFQRPFRVKSNRPATLYFHYTNQEPPESYVEMAGRFPENCFLFENHLGKSCLIVLADYQDLGRILAFSEKLVCGVFFKYLSINLDNDISPEFKISDKVWTKDKARVMAILNITPDSFFDGGKYFSSEHYDEIAQKLIDEGADIIDIGGESSRPGSQSVSIEEEIKRVLPAVEQIRKRFRIPISVDTVKPEVAEKVLEAGADMINDISGLSAGDRMVNVVSRYKASYCLMHIQGTPDRMQQSPGYTDIVAEVYRFLRKRLKICMDGGISQDKICIDPGIGFGKKFDHNLSLLRFLPAFSNLNHLILLGTSNKSFIGQALNREVEDRTAGSIATQVMGWVKGATIFRVHNVRSTRDALEMTKCYTQ